MDPTRIERRFESPLETPLLDFGRNQVEFLNRRIGFWKGQTNRCRGDRIDCRELF